MAKKTFEEGDDVEILRYPPRLSRHDQPWIRGTYVKPGDRYEHGWHWVRVAFREQVIVPARRIRKVA